MSNHKPKRNLQKWFLDLEKKSVSFHYNYKIELTEILEAEIVQEEELINQMPDGNQKKKLLQKIKAKKHKLNMTPGKELKIGSLPL